nr:HNH endonuclease signature motif containing protein [uncultured Pseudomonas sp.]
MRFSKEGYLQRKVTDTGYPPRDWKGVHILLWEEAHGPVPSGHCLAFRDGNKRNITLENLELITRAERMRRNTIHRYPPELKGAIRTLGRL